MSANTCAIARRQQRIVRFALAVADAADVPAGVAARRVAAARPRAHRIAPAAATPFPALDVRGVLHVYLLHWHLRTACTTLKKAYLTFFLHSTGICRDCIQYRQSL